MPRDVGPLEARERTHSDVIELREQKRIDEMPAIDCEFRIIDGLLRDLKSGRPRAEKTAAAPPVELGFQFLCACDKVRQIETEQVMAFDDVWVALFDERSESLKRDSFGFLDVFWIDYQQFFPA